LFRILRNLVRLAVIGRTAARHDALPETLLGTAPGLSWLWRHLARKNVPGRDGQRLARALAELGPTYIKLGQLLSTRSDLVGERMAATHRSAAWVHGLIDEVPVRHDLQRISAHRLHEPVDRRFVYRDPRIPDEDLVRLGGVPVTTPARTIADLARGTDETVHALLGQCAERAPHAAHGAIAWLAAKRRVPRRLAALALLEELVRKR
jgi:hypothetical protein